MALKLWISVLWIVLFIFVLAGCGRRKAVDVVFSQTSQATVMDASMGQDSIQIRISEGLQVTRLEKMSYPEGSFRTAVLAPMDFAVEGHEVVIDKGEVRIAGVPCGPIGNGDIMEISRKGVFVNGKHRCAFPP